MTFIKLSTSFTSINVVFIIYAQVITLISNTLASLLFFLSLWNLSVTFAQALSDLNTVYQHPHRIVTLGSAMAFFF